MPEIDGYTAVEILRRKDSIIPIIAFTAALYDGIAEDLKIEVLQIICISPLPKRFVQ